MAFLADFIGVASLALPEILVAFLPYCVWAILSFAETEGGAAPSPACPACTLLREGNPKVRSTRSQAQLLFHALVTPALFPAILNTTEIVHWMFSFLRAPKRKRHLWFPRSAVIQTKKIKV